MQKRNYLLLLGVGILYFILLDFLHFGFTFYWEEILVIMGGVAGLFLLDLDYFLYVFYVRPDDPLSFKAKDLFQKKDYRGMLGVIKEVSQTGYEFTLHSALFGPVIFILGVFVLTSSGSFFGAGLILGIFLRYIWDSWELQRKNPTELNKKLFWQIKTEVSLQTQKIFLLTLLVGFLTCSGMFIR